MNNSLSIKLYKNNDLCLNQKEVNYNLSDNRYKFILDDVQNSILIGEEQLVLVRDNQEYNLKLTINKNGQHTCEYLLKELDCYVDIMVDSAEFSFTDDFLEIYYQLETDDAFTKIEIKL